MIKINLCPIDELESQYWYVPDVVAVVVVALASFFAVQYYLGTIQAQVEELQTKTASLNQSTQKLAPDLERFKNLEHDVKELNDKLNALKSITVSKISKYQPAIVLEHLQNLKPEGVWYESIHIGFTEGKEGGGGGNGAPDRFEIKGQAFDNILTAELMTAMRSTASQEVDEADLRSQVYFTDLGLEDAQVPKNPPARFPELASYPEFVIKGRFLERAPAAATPKTKDVSMGEGRWHSMN